MAAEMNVTRSASSTITRLVQATGVYMSVMGSAVLSLYDVIAVHTGFYAGLHYIPGSLTCMNCTQVEILQGPSLGTPNFTESFCPSGRADLCTPRIASGGQAFFFVSECGCSFSRCECDTVTSCDEVICDRA